jgi:hypothetical protein
VTCTTQSRRWRSGQTSVSAVAFFKTPLTSSSLAADPKPDKAVTISPAQQWDSSKKSFTVWDNLAFTSSINTGSKTVSKGSIVGSATLGKEDFICFKDGETDIGIQVDAGSNDWDGWWDWDDNDGRGWGRRPPEKRQRGGNGWRGRGRGYLDCVADFWCGSLGK